MCDGAFLRSSSVHDLVHGATLNGNWDCIALEYAWVAIEDRSWWGFNFTPRNRKIVVETQGRTVDIPEPCLWNKLTRLSVVLTIACGSPV
jgi:hypothetical protein